MVCFLQCLVGEFALTQCPDSRRTMLKLKAVCGVNKKRSVTGGYAFQKYRYSDDQFNACQCAIPYRVRRTTHRRVT